MPQFKTWLQTPANLKKQASARDRMKDFVIETFGKTGRLRKTAGVEIHNMDDVAKAVMAMMAKQGQADTNKPYSAYATGVNKNSQNPGATMPTNPIPPARAALQVQPTVKPIPAPAAAVIKPIGK